MKCAYILIDLLPATYSTHLQDSQAMLGRSFNIILIYGVFIEITYEDMIESCVEFNHLGTSSSVEVIHLLRIVACSWKMTIDSYK